MNIVNAKIAELHPAEYNPRQMTAEQNTHLKASLERFGMVDPIVVNRHPDRDGIVVGGHQRLRIWGELGHKTIPTVEVELARDRERELNIRLNRNLGDWDWDVLANHFDLTELTDWGFSDDELTGLDWVVASDEKAQTGRISGLAGDSNMLLVAFGEYSGRVDADLVRRAGAALAKGNEDSDVACTDACERLLDEGEIVH